MLHPTVTPLEHQLALQRLCIPDTRFRLDSDARPRDADEGIPGTLVARVRKRHLSGPADLTCQVYAQAFKELEVRSIPK